MITAGAGGSQYGVNTAIVQFGDKLQGLPPSANTPVSLAWTIRTNGGGGQRHRVFCMNQLGNVGGRWGQAAGPGNRAGVSIACYQAEARYATLFPTNYKRNWPLRRIPRRPYALQGSGSSR
tara:strand:+ start:86 stop:448 length:363 start_codon:yes stop_codon:yes gene_type:complete